MISGGAFRVLVLGVALASAGCLQGGANSAKAIDPIPAPAWEPGYTWKYDVLSASHEGIVEQGRIDGDSDRDRTTVSMTVFNTTSPLLGEDVFYVRMSESLDHPLFHGNVQALTRDGLEVAGTAWTSNYVEVAKPMPVSPELDYAYSYPKPYDPCEGVIMLHATAAEARFPVLQFPLDDGTSRTGDISEGDDDFFLFHYTSRVHGLVEVTVPAGTFKAVYSTVDLVPEIPDEAQDYGGFSFRAKAEYWYSPDAQNLVKSLFSMTGQGRDPGEGNSYSFGYSSTMTLRSYDLTAGPDAPAPKVQEETHSSYEPARYWKVVADREFPINLADGDATVTFGLAPVDGQSRYPEDRPDVAESLPGSGLDPTKHRVYWRVWNDYESWRWDEGFGETFTYNFSDGGGYRIQGDVQPIECGGSWLGGAQASLPTFWQKSFKFPMEAGLPGTFEVAKFPVVLGASEGQVSWTMTPAFGTSVDRGRPVAVDPGGRTYPVGGAASTGSGPLNAFMAGTWRLNWETTSPTVGDDVTLDSMAKTPRAALDDPVVRLRVPLVTVDVVLLTPGESDLLVYLRKRAGPPFEGRLGLPGGPVEGGEATEASAQRVLETQTNLRDVYLRQLYTFSGPDRDPRGASVSVAYFALFPTAHQRPSAAPLEDAWLPLRDAVKASLAFDHAKVLATALERLKGRLTYTEDAYHLLPERFTIPQLQRIHELILGEGLKADVFTKRVRDALKPFLTREKAPAQGGGRPARLYANPAGGPR
ncbi:MAG: NUDIX hydrolase [Euryarchaeota archaeon]|nr:NUDIX hydrolase [Euryarchaeota archaeon]